MPRVTIQPVPELLSVGNNLGWRDDGGEIPGSRRSSRTFFEEILLNLIIVASGPPEPRIADSAEGLELTVGREYRPVFDPLIHKCPGDGEIDKECTSQRRGLQNFDKRDFKAIRSGWRAFCFCPGPRCLPGDLRPVDLRGPCRTPGRRLITQIDIDPSRTVTEAEIIVLHVFNRVAELIDPLRHRPAILRGNTQCCRHPHHEANQCSQSGAFRQPALRHLHVSGFDKQGVRGPATGPSPELPFIRPLPLAKPQLPLSAEGQEHLLGLKRLTQRRERARCPGGAGVTLLQLREEP